MSDSVFVHYDRCTSDETLSGILAWVPVGVFFTRHVYSFANITGTSMQVRPWIETIRRFHAEFIANVQS